MTYTNPLGYADGVRRTDPDPFVMRFRGRYYCYSTDEHQVNVSVSDDMVTWHRLGAALRADGRSHYWAPCVYYYEGVFHLYVSNRPSGSDDPHEEVLQLATSASPEGPFEVVHRFFDTFSIDPHVVPDGRGGWVMFYSVNDVTGLDDAYTGTSIVADRMPALDRLEGAPTAIVQPTLDEEIFERDRFGDGRDWYTIEGATYFTRGDRAYLTYSGNAYEREDYFIGYSSAPLDAAPHELTWTKHPDEHTWAPLVRRSSEVEGTGHNSIVRAPNLVDDWIVYHGRSAAEPLVPGVEQREMRIDAIRYMADRLVTDAPTATPQAAPSVPTVFDRFEAAVISEEWELAGDGTFAPSPDGAESTGGRAMLVHDHETTAYVAEFWLRAERGDLGSRVGAIVAWTDERNFTEALVDAASSSLVVRTWTNGLGAEVAVAPLTSVTPSVWHRLTITRAFGSASVAVDDQTAIAFAVPAHAARAGIVSVRTRARFAAFSLTDHVELRGAELSLPGTPFTCTPSLLADARGLTAVGSRPAVLTGIRPPHAATGHTVELLARDSRANVVPWERADSFLCVDLSRDRAHVTLVIAGATAESVVDERDGSAAVTVRTTVTPDGLVVQVDAATHRFRVPVAGVTDAAAQRIELPRAALTAYEYTDVPSSSPTPAKEHE